jgi:Rps23 Pro-64 3,4-dihydroxylase Tpa1-like proline 4-hydroxylase
MDKNIIVYNEFLSNDLFDEVQMFAENTIKSPEPYPGRTNLCWQDEIRNQSTPVIIRDIIEDTPIYNKLKSEIDSKTGLKVERLMLYFWTKLSYIPWHNDAHANSALTIYLNDYWDQDWGGYFMFKLNNEIKAIKPDRNLGVIQTGNVSHSVSTVNLDADLRITVQSFFMPNS